MLADREQDRRGGSERFAFLHQDGYAMYRVFGDDPMVVRVREFIAATTDAHIALWRALLGLDLMEKVVFGTHPADPLPYLLTDARVAASRHTTRTICGCASWTSRLRSRRGATIQNYRQS